MLTSKYDVNIAFFPNITFSSVAVLYHGVKLLDGSFKHLCCAAVPKLNEKCHLDHSIHEKGDNKTYSLKKRIHNIFLFNL